MSKSDIAMVRMGSAEPTIWNLNLSVANELAWKEGLGVSVFDECILHHLHHTKSRLERLEESQKKYYI